MVYILDEGSEFDAPLDRIWKYLQSNEEHDHKAIKTISAEMPSENVLVITNEMTLGAAPPVRNKIKLIMYPPFGVVSEFLEGPMAGSRSFQYYIPKGNKTGTTVVGEYVGKGMDDDSVKAAAWGFLELAFNEDNENLRKLVVTA